MRLPYFAAALSAVSLLSFAAAACSERAEPDAAQTSAAATPAPPIESNALPEDARPAPSEAVPVAVENPPS